MKEESDKGSGCLAVAAVLLCAVLVGMWFIGKHKENEAKRAWQSPPTRLGHGGK